MKSLRTPKKWTAPLFFFLFIMVAWPAQGESVSLRLSFNPNFISKGDLNTWVESLNSLWEDWQRREGGTLSGKFESIHYKPSFEGEVRINLIYGLALNFAVSYLSDKKEGTVRFQKGEGNHEESHLILNEVKAVPLKLGISYTFSLPYQFNISLGAGRHIIFVTYSTEDNYDYNTISAGREYSYSLEKDNTFRSESLGYYVSVGVEYNLTKFLALELSGEKTWSKVDGFKGPYSFQEFKSWLPVNEQKYSEEGKASLYYYESKNNTLNQYYTVLSGHKKRPDTLDVINMRQGELNFGGFILKIGIRLKI